ncbi:MAG: cobalamin B12-binding domain-containing protein [Alphaproteobacteria bacterium]|nr:cobalamin B12-binding domain-containing protein [Alphaproteobacteria bacterium]
MNQSRYTLRHPLRIVTAASLFDGHDAAINIMRRVLQEAGCEVIHLGHNRSVEDVAWAALQEDAQAVAVSSYQGGHVDYFRYLRRRLDELGAPQVRIFGGGGGVIVPEEIALLQDEGSVDRIYSPEDGRRLGLTGMIDDLLQRADVDPLASGIPPLARVREADPAAIARTITQVETALVDPACFDDDARQALAEAAVAHAAPVVGITGTGGAGKSSLTDELVRRWLFDQPTGRIAVLSIDPTRRRTGGALLGDRIRMNAIDPARVFVRSLATRSRKGELSDAAREAVQVFQAAGFDLVLVETSGIGQADADIVELADLSLYVMTPEYGAPSQLEKIEMLDLADLVVVNKFGKRGAQDAVRDVRKQVRRNRGAWELDDEALPVFGTSAARFDDPGVTALYLALLDAVKARFPGFPRSSADTGLPRPASRITTDLAPLVAPGRERHLGEIAAAVRSYHARTDAQAVAARRVQQLAAVLDEVHDTPAAPVLTERLDAAREAVLPEVREALERWPAVVDAYRQEELVYRVRGREIRQPLWRESLAGERIPRVALPRHVADHGELVRQLRKEGLPGRFPYTAGVFPLRREGEDPKRMFAGEGGPDKTNARFHLLCEGETAHRLSTAFDSVTLYGEDPAERPDIRGKIGESGVSVPHLDDMKRLYAGFDLCAPTTSVSMTINGPAPAILAMFLNTAIDDHVARWSAREGRAPSEDERAALADEAVRTVRGTVQADVLKEDQAQNTCIFSTEFALRMMGDIQAWFVDHQVRNFYSVSVSGYHIAEAGANPITQLAFTLANGFTLVEYYLARGMDIDAFAPNLSFFFSNGLDPEYTVIGRVARRIWAITLRDRYGASERSQKLKYHIQTSGRSLHAREVQFNDIRTTLQALLAITDACNSLHTNAYDEAITTPTEESVRRAMAIQLIINRELGASANENNLQGAWWIEELTDLVEEAVLREFERLDARGGVLGAMELQYQRSRIQDESMRYEHRKHDGTLPIIGINTFLDPSKGEDWVPETPELRRASDAEKDAQIASVAAFQEAHAAEGAAALARLQQVALAGGNTFDELMRTVRVATLGQITHALYEVGGAYRRNL